MKKNGGNVFVQDKEDPALSERSLSSSENSHFSPLFFFCCIDHQLNKCANRFWKDYFRRFQSLVRSQLLAATLPACQTGSRLWSSRLAWWILMARIPRWQYPRIAETAFRGAKEEVVGGNCWLNRCQSQWHGGRLEWVLIKHYQGFASLKHKNKALLILHDATTCRRRDLCRPPSHGV